MRLQGGARAGDGGRVPREDTVGTPRGRPQREGQPGQEKGEGWAHARARCTRCVPEHPTEGAAGAASGRVCAVGVRLLF